MSIFIPFKAKPTTTPLEQKSQFSYLPEVYQQGIAKSGTIQQGTFKSTPITGQDIRQQQRDIESVTGAGRVRIPFAKEATFGVTTPTPLNTAITNIVARTPELAVNLPVAFVNFFRKNLNSIMSGKPVETQQFKTILGFDPKRFGITDDVLIDTGKKMFDQYEVEEKKNPSKTTADRYKNALMASAKTIVPDTLDALFGFGVLQSGVKIGLGTLKMSARQLPESLLFKIQEKRVSPQAIKDVLIGTKNASANEIKFARNFINNLTSKERAELFKLARSYEKIGVSVPLKGETTPTALGKFAGVKAPKTELPSRISGLLPGKTRTGEAGFVSPSAMGDDFIKLAKQAKDISEFKKVLSKEQLALLTARGFTAETFFKEATQTIPKELTPLAQEARKYKTAEEFVKAQPKVYHGTSEIIKGEFKYPLYLTDNPTYANVYKLKSASSINPYKKGGGEKVYEFIKIAPKNRTLDVRNPKHLQLLDDYFKEGSLSGGFYPSERGLVDWTEAEGIADFVKKKKLPFDALLIDEGGIPMSNWKEIQDRGIGYVALNKNAIKTKSQLIDIYNQAVKTVPEAQKGVPEALKVEKGITPPSAQKILGIEPSPLITKRETTLLKDKIRNLARGAREGSFATREQINQVQTDIANMIKQSGMEAKDKAKFLSTIKNIQTPVQLQKAMPGIETRITRSIEAETKRGIQDKIDRELKYTKAVKAGDRRVGKYDYESNKFFEGLRESNRLTKESAQAELNLIPKEGLTEMQKIEARFLSYKANGMEGSLALHEQVLADVDMMKRMGEQAKDEADFIKKMNRQEKADEFVTNLLQMKGDRKSLITKMENVYRLGFTNTYSMINSIAGKEIATKYDPTLLENRRDSSIYYATKKITDKAVKIFDLKSSKQFTKKLYDMAGEKFNITDRQGLTTEISKMEVLDIYNATKNTLVRERYYNAFGKNQTESLIANLSPKEMELADAMQAEVQAYREILNKRNIEIAGRDMGYVENYWPSSSEFEPSVLDDIRMQGETPSAVKERAKSSMVFPIPKNAWVKMAKHISQAEHIDKLSRRYEELKRIVKDREVKNRVTNKFGERVYRDLDRHIDNISLNNVSKALDAVSGVYQVALNNWVKAKIAISPTVFARQLASQINYMEGAKKGEYMKYYLKGIANPKATFDFVWKNAPFLKARFNKGYSEALQDAIKGSKMLGTSMDSWTKGLTAMTRSGDVTAIIYGGYPTIMSELAKHGNMQKAIDVFETKTLQSQQAGVKSSLSHWQNSSDAFAKAFLRFKNTINQYARKQGDAIIDLRNGDISATQFTETTMIYSVLNPMLYVLLGWGVVEAFKATGRAIKGESQDIAFDELGSDITEQIAINPFLAIPLIDDLAKYVYRKSAGKKTYDVFNTPMLDEITTAFQKLGKKEPTFKDYLEAISAMQEPATAIPTQSFLRYYKYINEKEESKSSSVGGAIDFGFGGSKIKAGELKLDFGF